MMLSYLKNYEQHANHFDAMLKELGKTFSCGTWST